MFNTQYSRNRSVVTAIRSSNFLLPTSGIGHMTSDLQHFFPLLTPDIRAILSVPPSLSPLVSPSSHPSPHFLLSRTTSYYDTFRIAIFAAMKALAILMFLSGFDLCQDQDGVDCNDKIEADKAGKDKPEFKSIFPKP